MTDFVPDSVWIYAGSDGGWTDTGEWSCDVEPDCAHYWPHVKMLTATPPREHAEELVEALRDCCIWMEIARNSDYYGGWEWEPDDEYTRATNLLARIEQETDR